MLRPLYPPIQKNSQLSAHAASVREGAGFRMRSLDPDHDHGVRDAEGYGPLELSASRRAGPICNWKEFIPIA